MHTNQKAAVDEQSLSSSQTKSRDAKPTRHIEITHPNIVNLKLAFHKRASFHPHYSTFTPQTYHQSLPSAPVQVMAYADDITITSTHTSTSAANKYIQPYLHKVFSWTKQNNLLLNPDKTTCTLFTPDPAEYTSNLDLTINNKTLPIAMHPKVLATYKAVMRPALEYASYVWSPITSSTSINKRQVMQNAALRTATGCTHDTNIQHLHDETLTLPIHEHLQLHASQCKQKTQHPSHPLHKPTTYFNTPRLKTLFLTMATTQQTFP